jgi:[ribosomal protein S18]-alanine N-acetyltransferase
MPATLREYDPSDFDALHSLDRACYPPGISYSRRTLKWFLALPGADCLVAENREKPHEILGFIVAEADDEAHGHIITIDIAESSRRSGVGTALLRAMEQRLAARGVSRVTLETATSNEPAVAFWQRHGYRTHGVLPRYYLGRLDAYSMSKLLAPVGGLETR